MAVARVAAAVIVAPFRRRVSGSALLTSRFRCSKPSSTPFLRHFTVSNRMEAAMKAVQFHVGGAEGLYISPDVARPTLKEHEVLVKVTASAVNRADILQRRGMYPVPPGESTILGLEASGIIAERHPSCSSAWSIGERAMALLAGGGNAEYVAVPEDQLMAVPAGVTMTEAAGIPEAWLTAYQLLNTLAKVQPGETVLIHAAASGVGTAATQIASAAGCTVLATAGSQRKLDFVQSMGARHAINYKENSFDQAVLQYTNGRGVDVVLDCVGGSYWEQNINALTRDGRWILYGLLGGNKVSGDLLGRLLMKRITLIGTTLRSRSKEYKAELVRGFSKDMIPLFESKRFKPVIDKCYPLADIAEAHKYIEHDLNIGKVILTVCEDQA